MLRAILTILCALFLLVNDSYACQKKITYNPVSGGGGGGSCPQPGGATDGCSAATGGNFLSVTSPSLWSAYARTNGQTWAGGAHPWSWNAPGIDYKVGYYTALASLKDPAANGVLPTGCTYSATGNALGGPQVECASGSNITISGFDFSLHNCVALKIDAAVSGTLTITNNNFKNGTNCAVTHAQVTGTLNASSPTSINVTSVQSGSIVSGDYLVGGEITSNTGTVSGSGGTGTYSLSGVSCTGGCSTASTPYIFGKALPQLISLPSNGAVTSIVFTYNNVDGDGVNNPISYTSQYFLDLGAGSSTTSIDVEYNVFLRIPSRPIAFGTANNASIKVLHNYFEDYAFNAADNHAEVSVNIVSNTLTLQQWSYNVFLKGKTAVFPGGTAQIWLGTSITGEPTVTTTQVDHNIAVTDCVPNNGRNGSPAACNVTSPGNFLSSSAALSEAQDLIYTNISFTSNYIDETGAFFSNYEAGSSGTTDCTNKPVWSGNVNLVSGAAITDWESKNNTNC